MNMYLIDTNILSYFVRGNPGVVAKFLEFHDQIQLTSIVAVECFFGANKVGDQDLIEIYESIFETYPVLGFNLKEAKLFAKLKSDLQRTGQGVEDFDLLIAVIALSNNLTLVTNNLKHFKNIKGLNIINWAQTLPSNPV